MNKSTVTPKARFTYFPAATLYRKVGGLGAYVRYKRPREVSASIIVKAYRPNFVWLDCPDRELVLVSDQHKLQAFVPTDADFDEFYDFNVSGNEELERLMINYVQCRGKSSPHARQWRGSTPPVTQVWGDSGGYQLKTSKLDFVNPYQLAQWYRNNVDYGLVLDLPTIFEATPLAVVERLALIQRKNTEIIQAGVGSQVSLVNIIHGVTPEQRRLYGEIVADPTLTTLAVNHHYYKNMIATTHSLYQVLTSTTGYTHLHVLGVSSLAHLAILVKLANSPQHPLTVSSDSSTHVHAARARTYFTQAGHSSPPLRAHIGTPVTRGGVPSASPYQFAPCSCKVCRAVKYLEVLGTLEGAIASFLLAYHNMQEILRFTRHLNYVCTQVTAAEYRQYCVQLFSTYKGYREMLQGLDFITHADTHGLAAAEHRYATYLTSAALTSHIISSSLFADTPITAGNLDPRSVDLATRYEQFHARI